MRRSPTTRCLACSPATFSRQLRRYCSQRTAAVYHHSQDFDWEELRKRAAVDPFSASSPTIPPDGATQELLWESSYKTHAEQSSHLFEERRYLLQAFPSLSSGELQVLEVGCGNGSSTTPILSGNPKARVHATDPSETAVEITRTVCENLGVADRLTTEVQSADGPLGGALHGHFDAALLVFTLSAVPRPGDVALFNRVASALRPGGVLLFRDYGNYDLRMLRDVASASGAPQTKSKPPGSEAHQKKADALTSTRVGEREFIRPGGYFRRYYALEDLHNLVASAGVQLAVEELRYLCVRVANARRGLSMDRVFCHGVLRREEDR